MKTKEYYTNNHEVNVSEQEILPPDYAKWLDEQNKDVWKELDKDTKAQQAFEDSLNDIPF